MPIFMYECKKCNKEFEKLVIKDTCEIICPTCKSDSVRKIMSSSIFKIKGFSYENGYSKTAITDESIIKNGPLKSIEQMKHNMS